MAIFTESGKAVAPVNLDGTPMADAASDTNDTGAKEQEVTDPASDPDTVEGTEEQDLADPDTAEDAEESAEAEEAAPEAGEQVEPSAKPKQSKAENRKFAAKRRAEELEAAKAAAFDEVISKLSIMNPKTGKPCETYAEYIAMQEGERTDKVRAELVAKGVDPATIEELVTQNPAVTAAEEAIERAEAAEAAAKQKADGLSFEKLLADVGSVLPDIRTAEDLFAWERYDEFRLLVSGGKDPLHAAKVLSGGATAAAAQQAALNAIASKSHLTGTNTRRSNGGDYGISDVQYANMRALHPNISRKDAAAFYNKYGK